MKKSPFYFIVYFAVCFVGLAALYWAITLSKTSIWEESAFAAWYRMFLYHYTHPMQYIGVVAACYALVATIALSQRNLSERDLAILTTFAGVALALVAVVQGAWAAKLINTPTEKEGLIGTFRFKLALLGSVETFAIFALVGTLVFSARLSA